jgi:hypothetical protein
VIELRLNNDGEGDGRISVATKILGNKDTDTVIMENLSIQPILLQSVRRERNTR